MINLIEEAHACTMVICPQITESRTALFSKGSPDPLKKRLEARLNNATLSFKMK